MVVVVIFVQFSCIASLLSSPTVNVRADDLFWKLNYPPFIDSRVIKVRYSVQSSASNNALLHASKSWLLTGLLAPFCCMLEHLYMYRDSGPRHIPIVHLCAAVWRTVFPQCSVWHIGSLQPGLQQTRAVAPSADSHQLSGAQWSSAELSS